jgi:hypothetical protein
MEPMLATNSIAPDVGVLRAALDGRVVLPGDQAWDEARQAWNLAVDQRPAMVALPRSAEDVQALVGFARARGLRIAVQATGHAAAPMGSLADTLLVKTSAMRGVTIDPWSRVARVEAGALWADVTTRASEYGLAPLAGSSPDVGVVGYTLGGGLSWLGRRYGLASDRLLAAELVTADGRLVRADRRNEPELFWGLRGGGGSFGAVTAIEFELIPAPLLYAGMMLWPWKCAREVLHAWREWTVTAPDTVTTSARIMQFPPLPDLPPFLRGRGVVVIDGAYLGDRTSAADLLAPLRALVPELDTFAMVRPDALSHIHMDPEHPVPGIGDHALLEALPADAVDALVDAGGEGSGSPLLALELRHLGGALAQQGTGALDRLAGEYMLFTVGVPMDPALARAIAVRQAQINDALAPYLSDRRYRNFAERPADPATFHGPEAYARLQRVKAEVDPDGVFQANHDLAAG